MRTLLKIVALAAVMALGATPALAMGPPSSTSAQTATAKRHTPPGHGAGDATGNHGNQGGSNKPSTPGPTASMPAKAKAYGRYCKGESKQHVAGTRGTPFSTCVTDMAKLANGSSRNPTAACKSESRHHIAGQRGTPFSQCVSAAAKLMRHLDSSGSGTTTTPTTTTPTTTTPTTTTGTTSGTTGTNP